MNKLKLLKKSLKGFASVLLVLSVMLSLAVPFDISVFAEEDADEASNNICALLYKIDGSSTNLELVFQNDDVVDPLKDHVATYTDFASSEYVNKTFDLGSHPGYASVSANTTGLPWYNPTTNNNTYIKTITFRDEIKPKSIASWFYNCTSVNKINDLEKLNMSNCENIAFAFYYFCTDSNSLKTLDLSCFNKGNSNTSKVSYADYFYNSTNIQTLNLSDFDLSGIGRVEQYNGNNYYVSRLSRFLYGDSWSTGRQLGFTTLKLDGMNLSGIRMIQSFLAYSTKLKELDLSNLKQPPKDAYNLQY